MRKIGNIRRAVSHAVMIAALVALAACSNTKNPLESGAPAVPGSTQDFVVNAGDRVFFTTDSAELTPQARETLEKQVLWLKKYAHYAIRIEGHADERGTREYNIALGARRATTVRNYLVGQGIDAGRLKTLSYGKERPVAVCDDISYWSQNRRAVTVISGQGAS